MVAVICICKYLFYRKNAATQISAGSSCMWYSFRYKAGRKECCSMAYGSVPETLGLYSDIRGFWPLMLSCICISPSDLHGILLSYLDLCFSFMSCLVLSIQKCVINLLGPVLSSSLQPLSCQRDVASVSLLYRYYHGKCYCVLQGLVPWSWLPVYSSQFSCWLSPYNLSVFKSNVSKLLSGFLFFSLSHFHTLLDLFVYLFLSY